MKQVVITGWEFGFQKVEFTKALQREVGLSLTDAKAVTDAVLDGQQKGLHVEDCAVERVLCELRCFGAKCLVVDRPQVVERGDSAVQ